MSDATMSLQQSASPPASSDRSRLTYSPHVDICDAGGKVMLIADLPGKALAQEYGIGDYRRSFRLGEGFDPSEITAEAKHGVLTIHVPRLAAVRPRKIVVQAT